MTHFTTLHEMIAVHAQQTPDAVAMTAPSATPLSYGGLHQLIAQTMRTLNAMAEVTALALSYPTALKWPQPLLPLPIAAPPHR